MPQTPLTGPVEIIGTGLLGTSLGLACRRAGLEVLLSDTSAEHVRTASGLGAGRPRLPEDEPQLIVVAVPPAELGTVIAKALETGAAVTDVGSVKKAPLAALGGDTSRYVGSHPMAGSERSGPLAGTATLFDGRPWALTPHPGADGEVIGLVEQLARLCGAIVVTMSPEDHDRAVARTSHVPHLMSVLVAARLADAPADQLALSGQGVRDVTRIAGGDPHLYSQIVAGNAEAVTALLGEVRDQLDELIAAISTGDRDRLLAVLEQGQAGARAIPGKHGGLVVAMQSVYVVVPDHPGELARLFADISEIGANIEDVRIDHDPGRPFGVVELTVASEAAEDLLAALESRDWSTHR